MWIGERFDDEGWSGATLDRPALRCLLAKIRNGDLDRVLVYRLDRLSRNVVDSVVFLQEFRERGIDLVIVTSPEIGSAVHDSLVLNLLSVFAEFERDMSADASTRPGPLSNGTAGASAARFRSAMTPILSPSSSWSTRRRDGGFAPCSRWPPRVCF